MKRNINTRVLDGFVKQAVSHNKYLEESEMWKKKRELEGNADKKPSSSERHRRASSTDEEASLLSDEKKAKDPAEIDDLQVLLELYRESKNPSNEKWGHSGFDELYPNHGTRRPKSPDPSQRNRSRSSSSSSSSESRASAERRKRKKSKHKSKHKKSHSKPKKRRKKEEKGLK